ncbi:MAG TPA: STAS/SEC14 domain-containing protein [Pseudolabrys sp.]|nr:STAS/SEC14 domain-containing protein [Pseudolabrys sp.]
MIDRIGGFPDNVLAFLCKGRVTKTDYDTVLVPAVLEALKTRDKLRLYYQIDADFTGFDPGAMWEDFKVGMEHLSRWERIALVSDVEWIKQMMRLFGFMVPAAIRSFPLAQAAEARAWIVGSD